MARTRFKGPAYGAKCLLAVVSMADVSVSVTDEEQWSYTLPTGQDWYITEVSAYCSDQGNGGTVDVEDDGTSVLGANITLSTGADVAGTITATSGEDEGKRVAAGSLLTVDATNGATTTVKDLAVSIWGYIRYVAAPV